MIKKGFEGRVEHVQGEARSKLTKIKLTGGALRNISFERNKEGVDLLVHGEEEWLALRAGLAEALADPDAGIAGKPMVEFSVEPAPKAEKKDEPVQAVEGKETAEDKIGGQPEASEAPGNE